jgi:hypothetical protein
MVCYPSGTSEYFIWWPNIEYEGPTLIAQSLVVPIGQLELAFRWPTQTCWATRACGLPHRPPLNTFMLVVAINWLGKFGSKTKIRE